MEQVKTIKKIGEVGHRNERVKRWDLNSRVEYIEITNFENSRAVNRYPANTEWRDLNTGPVCTMQTEINQGLIHFASLNTGGIKENSILFDGKVAGSASDTTRADWVRLASMMYLKKWSVAILPEFFDHEIAVKPLNKKGYEVYTFIQSNNSSRIAIALHAALCPKVKNVYMVPFGEAINYKTFFNDPSIVSQPLGVIDVEIAGKSIRIIANHTTAGTAPQQRVGRFNFIQKVAEDCKSSSGVLIGGDFNPYGIDMDMTSKLWGVLPAKYKFPLSFIRHATQPYQNKTELKQLQFAQPVGHLEIPDHHTFEFGYGDVQILKYVLDLIQIQYGKMIQGHSQVQVDNLRTFIPNLDHHAISTTLRWR